jgi:hypothetical protein
MLPATAEGTAQALDLQEGGGIRHPHGVPQPVRPQDLTEGRELGGAALDLLADLHRP